MNNPNSRVLQLFAIFGFALWTIIFSAGILMSSEPYRIKLGYTPKPPPGQATLAPATQPQADAVAKKAEPGSGGAEIGLWETLWSFIAATFLYTPINTAILCALAGFIGGCASNLALENSELKDLTKNENRFVPDELARLKTRLQYLQENPFLSMLRGFVVYLTFLAGVLVAVENPFGDVSEAKYLRYAGILSLVAFGMGYDPSRFEQLLESIPQMGLKRKEEEQKEGVTAVAVAAAATVPSSNAPGASPAAVVVAAAHQILEPPRQSEDVPTTPIHQPSKKQKNGAKQTTPALKEPKI